MSKLCWAAMAALCCIVSPGFASAAGIWFTEESRMAEERLLGSGDERSRHEALLPFSRKLTVAGTVTGPLQRSLEADGIPAAVALEVAHAFSGALDLEEDLIVGDFFTVAYHQEYTIDGTPIGVPRAAWAELHTATRGSFSVHRFRAGRDRREGLWLASGEGAGPRALRWPVDDLNISSGFGLRVHPLLRLPSKKNKKKGTGGPPAAARRFGLTMHQGVDFAAETGTPIYAAMAGTVTGARPNGGYGNWIEISHEGDLQTIYGHMFAFAPGIKEGVTVDRGQLIGFVGSTGRSTGPHLHFELLHKGTPSDPIMHPALRRPQLKGGELAKFRRAVARDLAEAGR